MGHIQEVLQVGLLSSVSHIGTTASIDAEFHRIQIITPEGEELLVPTITGNSIRGQLRDMSAMHLLRTVGIQSLPIKEFYLLFSGGSLEKGQPGLSLKKVRRLRELLPSVSLWGGASGNHIMQGKWASGSMIPMAQETKSLLGLPEGNYPSIYNMMQIEEYTRSDDAKNEHYETLIIAEDLRSETDKLDKKSEKGFVEETGASQQMRYRVETMSAGVQLAWRTVLFDVTHLEEQAWYAALAEWGQYPTIGGKIAVGHGLVELTGRQIYIHPDRVSVPSFEQYENHLYTNATEIIDLLGALATAVE